MNPEPTTLNAVPLSAAVPLAHALIAEVASREGIRILFIKGPALTAQGLSAPKLSADVDVWVEPGRHADLVSALGALGWSRRVESRSFQLFITHSVTLVCEGWPSDIDVHDRFPGAFAKPEALFEVLWASRTFVPLEVGPVAVPGPAHHAVIALLHALREASHERREAQVLSLLTILHGWSGEQLSELVAAAEDMGAAEVAAERLAPLGVHVRTPEKASNDLLVWRMRRANASRSVDWALQLMSVPRGQRLAELRAAILPSRSDVAADHPEASRSQLGRVGVRLTRLARAVRSLPSIVRALRIARHEDTRRAFETTRDARAEDIAVEPAPLTAPVHPPVVSAPVAAVAAGDGDRLWARASALVEVSRDEIDYVLALRSLERPPLVVAGSASLIWQAIDGTGSSAEDIAAGLAAEVGLDAELIRPDVVAFLDQLDGLGLVQSSTGAASANASLGTKNSSTAATSAPSPQMVQTSR